MFSFYVCGCICAFLYGYMPLCILCVRLLMCITVCLCMYVSSRDLFMCVCMPMYMCVHDCVSIHVFVCRYVCAFLISVYLYIMYVYMHICMYVRAGRPAFARPYVGVHRSTSLMSSSLFLQQCPACLVRLT